MIGQTIDIHPHIAAIIVRKLIGSYDINLSSWRDIVFNKKYNWIDLFKDKFNINMCIGNWIHIKNVNTDFKNKILISVSLKRDNNNINWNTFLKKYDISKLHFMCLDENEYIIFKQKTNIDIPYTHCKTILDLIIRLIFAEDIFFII